jgi:hypothetical protein
MPTSARLNDFSRQGDPAMILFPAMMIGGHLLIAVVDKVPDLNFEPICREGAADLRSARDDSQVCMTDEKAARDELAKKWSEFAAADRARCIRLATNNRTASYVEVLTCLELDQEARKLRQGAIPGIAAPESGPGRAQEDASPPEPAVRVARQPAAAAPPPPPLPLAPRPAAAGGFPQALCLPGLRDIIAACNPSGGRP